MAEKSLKNAFDLFSIEYILLKRIQPPHEDPTGITAQYKRMLCPASKPSMLQNAGSAYSTVEGPLPAITRKGFVDLLAFEEKAEPAREWGRWSRLLRKWNLPRYLNWGDLPRNFFLEYPGPLTMQRVAEIRKIGERKAQVPRLLLTPRAAHLYPYFPITQPWHDRRVAAHHKVRLSPTYLIIKMDIRRLC